MFILILAAVPGARAETVNFFGPGSPTINYTGTVNNDQVNVSGFISGDTITGAWNGAGGTNTLNWSGSGTFNGTIDNFHLFNKTGAGLLTINTILDLSGLGNGVTVIRGGTLAFTATNGLISQFITVQGGASLILNPGGGSDFQDLTVDQGGTVILNQAELWGDTLTINGRLLADTGSFMVLGTGVLVGATGTLTATTVVSDLINFGTVVVPNNGIGMLVVGGYYNAPGATLEVPVRADGSHGLFFVGDIVLLDGGTLRIIPLSGYYARGTRLQIMDVGFGIAGTFGRVVNGLGSARLIFSADYSIANELWVVVNKRTFTFLAASWLQPYRSVAGILDALEPGASTDLLAVIGALDLLPSDQLRAALGQLTPLVYDAFPRLGYDVSALFAASILDRLNQRRHNLGAIAWAGPALPGYVSAVPGAGGRPATDKKFGVFVRTFGAHSRQDPAADRYGFDAETFGLTAGADWRVTRHLFLGLALGYAHVGLKLDDPAHSDGTLQSFALGLYGGWS
ncbi:MAG: autotransporter outer membrane beta-barrel domain-containing protein, partial [Proteobacteria bacterium]|nr:autotransporter outer membrane beta-barrel domain-containing protein [Pseudomonadota bacterium]